MSNLKTYLKNKADSLPFKRIGNFNIIFKNSFDKDIDYKAVLQNLNRILPNGYTELIDVIYVGKFNYFEENDFNALYKDGAMYISNVQDDERDLEDDVVHELAHAVEEKYGYIIYEDQQIKNNFLSKRATLKRILDSYDYNTAPYDFQEVEYNKKFDDFLYKEVGYDKLTMLTINLFLNSYSITSLREYFATGFEEYYIGKIIDLKQVCPYVYDKLQNLEYMQEKENEL